MDDATFTSTLSTMSEACKGIPSDHPLGPRNPFFCLPAKPKLCFAAKVVKRALEVRDDIFLDRKITPLKELQRTASITYMGAVKGFEGLEETLSAPKLSSDLGKTELAQQVNSIPSSLLDKEFQKRRDFLAALSLTTALEVFFQDSDRQLSAQALAFHSMKDLWDKMVAWMRIKVSTPLPCAEMWQGELGTNGEFTSSHSFLPWAFSQGTGGKDH